MMLFTILYAFWGVTVPTTLAQDIFCFAATHECCSLTTVDESSVDVTFITRDGPSNTGLGVILDIKVKWNETQTSSAFNGYGVCLQDPPYNNQPPGFACSLVGTECLYQITKATEYIFEDVMFGESFFFIVRIAQWREDGTHEYFAPRETDIQINTPECTAIADDISKCSQQGLQTTTKLPSTMALLSSSTSSSVSPTSRTSSPLPLNCLFSPDHQCCDLPTVDENSINVSFLTRSGNETLGEKWILDATFTWDKPGEQEFNGYGVCLQAPPRNNPPPGFFCARTPESVECAYIFSTRNQFTYSNILYGYSFYFVVRVAQLNEDRTYEFLAPREVDVQVVTPDCFEETGDLDYCREQPIETSSKPTVLTVDKIIRADDTLADIDISWREPVQINGILSTFNIKAENDDRNLHREADKSDILIVTESQRSNGRNTSYTFTLEGLFQNLSYSLMVTPTIVDAAKPGHSQTVQFHIPVLEPATTSEPSNSTLFFQSDDPILSSSAILGTVEIAVVTVCGIIAAVVTIVVIVIVLSKKREEKDDTVFVRYSDDTIIRKSSSTMMLDDIEEKEIDPVFVDIEMDRSKLKMEDELGSGQFGVVYKAFAYGLKGEKEEYIQVAVKGLKGNATRAMKEDFLDEIKLIIEIGSHPNILSILGCVTADEPYYLVTEFMKYGDLLHFLWRCREEKYISLDPIYNVSNINKIQIARQVARGMEYLANTRYYHGDLAARNVLVGEDLVVKISDFGMADDIYMRGYKRLAPERKRPVKWVSLETNTKGQCSIESDVWSYGIVLYEIYTLGGVPYPAMDGRAVIDRLQQGWRMEQPDGCPNDVYNIMRKCWLEIPDERPSFHELYQTFDKMLASQSDYLPAFELMDDDGDDDDNDDDCGNGMKTDEIPPSYADQIVYVPKSRSNSYVEMKTKVNRQISDNYVNMTEEDQLAETATIEIETENKAFKSEENPSVDTYL